jgi:hypothetical protein
MCVIERGGCQQQEGEVDCYFQNFSLEDEREKILIREVIEWQKKGCITNFSDLQCIF